MTLAGAECFLSGQVCASLTRIVVPRQRHDEFTDALAAAFSAVQVGDPFDATTQMGPLAMERQRDRVEHYIAKGIEQGATLVTGGGRPKHLERGYYIEPTVFAGVDNKHVIAQEEIFGPVLSVIPADNEEHAVDIANDTIYGLNASVFTPDAARPATSPPGCGRARWATTRSGSTSGLPSEASSSPGWDAKAAEKACCHTWRPRQCCSTRRLRGTRRSPNSAPKLRDPNRKDHLNSPRDFVVTFTVACTPRRPGDRYSAARMQNSLPSGSASTTQVWSP